MSRHRHSFIRLKQTTHIGFLRSVLSDRSVSWLVQSILIDCLYHVASSLSLWTDPVMLASDHDNGYDDSSSIPLTVT